MSIDKSSEEWRHICEIEEVFRRFETHEERKEYLRGVQEKRGIEAYNKLREGLIKEWKRRQKTTTG